MSLANFDSDLANLDSLVPVYVLCQESDPQVSIFLSMDMKEAEMLCKLGNVFAMFF
jgi:hypothetical protein